MRRTQQPTVAGFANGGRGHEPKNVELLATGKGKETDSSLEPQKEMQPC